VHETSESVEELNSNIQSASDNLQSLAQSSAETAEAAQKVGESFNLMLAGTSSLHETVGRTGDIVARMVASVNEVAGSIKELSQGAERSSMSMSEMDRSISEVSSSAADTAQIARKAIDVAQEGAVAVRRTIEGMDRIVNSTRDASSVIVGLGNRIEEIGSILGVIDEIADQTNLLALNAAIIAAQAGEHGRSFAVVADEIRSLAERTASSTREINQMIGDIQETSEQAIKVMKGGGATVNEGVGLARKAGDALNQILLSFQKAVENVETIAGYTEGQAQSSITVAREIGHVAEMAARISQASAEQSQAGGQLQESFQETLRTTQSLSKMVNQQAQENRQAIAAVAEMNESTTRANQALLDQSKVSDGILQAIEQVREIAKNHAKAASEMGEATQFLAEKSARLKEEIGEFHI
jgi:methyl-accepting chemotaxis protein